MKIDNVIHVTIRAPKNDLYPLQTRPTNSKKSLLSKATGLSMRHQEKIQDSSSTANITPENSAFRGMEFQNMHHKISKNTRKKSWYYSILRRCSPLCAILSLFGFLLFCAGISAMLVVLIGTSQTMTAIATCNRNLSQTFYSTDVNPVSIAVADFNGDNKIDIVVANQATENVGVLLNNGNHTFATQVTYATPAGYSPRAVTTGDIDGDGTQDIVVANYDVQVTLVFLNGGNGVFFAQAPDSTDVRPYAVVAADVNGDGQLDVIVANFGASNVGVLLNTGSGIFASQVIYSAGSGPRSVALADVDGDGALDIVVANYNSNNIGVLLNTGSGTFAAQVTYTTGASPISVTTADVNGDSKPDIIVANIGSSNVGVFINNGNGIFAAQVVYSTLTGSGTMSVTTADFNGDNKVDIIVANNGFNNIGILINNGYGTFATQITYPVGSGPSSVVAADLNGDNLIDIFVTNSLSNSVSVLLAFCN